MARALCVDRAAVQMCLPVRPLTGGRVCQGRCPASTPPVSRMRVAVSFQRSLAYAVHTRAGRAMAAASGSRRSASFPAANYSDLMLLTRREGKVKEFQDAGGHSRRHDGDLRKLATKLRKLPVIIIVLVLICVITAAGAALGELRSRLLPWISPVNASEEGVRLQLRIAPRAQPP
eukprot:SM000049S16726  [mRNA]  locus=s49:374782:378441:+ [translate_table: standard]